MALDSYTTQCKITTTTLTPILSNTGTESIHFGQIDIVNESTIANTIDLVIVNNSIEYLWLRILIEKNGSRTTIENKIPYEIKSGMSLQGRLATADTTGMSIHVHHT